MSEPITNPDGSLSPIGLERRFAQLEIHMERATEVATSNQRSMAQVLDGLTEFKADTRAQTRAISDLEKQVRETNGQVKELRGRVGILDAWKEAQEKAAIFAKGVMTGEKAVSNRDKALIGGAVVVLGASSSLLGYAVDLVRAVHP